MNQEEHVVLLGSIDRAEVADLVCSILVKIRQNRRTFEQHAKQRGISLDQLTAAAITEAACEHLKSYAE